MARHIYRYRTIIDEFPCSTDGRPSYSNRATIVPVTLNLPNVETNQPQYAHAQYLASSTEVHHLNNYQSTPLNNEDNNNLNNNNIYVNIIPNDNNNNNGNNYNTHYNYNRDHPIPVAYAVPV